MKRYLLDTNVCVFFLRKRFGVAQRIAAVGWSNCCISEITVAELLDCLYTINSFYCFEVWAATGRKVRVCSFPR